MDTRDLFRSCRKGDYERVRVLVEEREVEVNVRDKWDSTPLYYACLCGHNDIVRLLLDNGAKCEPSTFDGERCLYGALNSDIRHLLKNRQVISSTTIRREYFTEFLRKALETGEYGDVCFMVHGQRMRAHKCILSARSPYFQEMFLEKWRKRSEIHINHNLVAPQDFHAILQYIYTGQLKTRVESIEDVKRLAKQCRLEDLLEKLVRYGNAARFFRTTKPGTNVKTVTVESPENWELQRDFSLLAEGAVPVEFRRWFGGTELPFPALPSYFPTFPDLVFRVGDHDFYGHKVFFCYRSEYFRTLLRNPLGEELEEQDEDLLVVQLRQFSPSVFKHILFYVYQDSAELDVENVEEVLIAADVALLPGLKRLCGSFMAEYLDEGNVISAIQTARLFQLPRLEDLAYRFIAENLEEMLDAKELHDLILEDAGAVMGREAVDSIDVIDNVRFHLTASSMDEAHDKLEMIEELLAGLGLDA